MNNIERSEETNIPKDVTPTTDPSTFRATLTDELHLQFEISLLVVLIVLVAAFYMTQIFKQPRKNLPPGPLGLPVVGYLPFLDPSSPHLSLTDLSIRFGPIYSIQLGSIFTVVLSDVKLVRQALALESLTGRAPLYLTHGIMKGNGIICVQGEKWKETRKFVASCLRNFGMVKFGDKRHKMEADIKRGVTQLLTKLKQTEGTPVEMGHLLMHSLGNVVFNLVFGKMWEEEDETWKELINLQEEGTKLIGIAGPINFLPFLRFLPKYKKIIKYIEEGIAYSHVIYQRILEEFRETSNDDPEQSPHFLSYFNKEMIRRKNEKGIYTPTQFNYLMADLWGAGVDTTITTLSWFFLYIAHHKEHQRRIQKEMDEVVGKRELCLGDVEYLPFLRACISEAQRIRSVTPLGIPHGATQAQHMAFAPENLNDESVFFVLIGSGSQGELIFIDCSLNGYHIPKGTMVIPLQWAIHMNPEFYPNPNAYDPNRFLTDNGKYMKPDAFIPFQTGKRTCVGEEYAKMLLFLYAGTVVQKFTLHCENEADFEGDVGITLTPKPQKIKFFSRTHQSQN